MNYNQPGHTRKGRHEASSPIVGRYIVVTPASTRRRRPHQSHGGMAGTLVHRLRHRERRLADLQRYLGTRRTTEAMREEVRA